LGDRYYSKTGCDGMGMCCEKKTVILCRNVWNMRWWAPDQEVDQRGHGKRWCEKDCQARNLNKEDAMDRGEVQMICVLSS